MISNLSKELHYQYRSLRLCTGFLLKRFIHCNLQLTYRCNFTCQICDFWKNEYDKQNELTFEDIRLIGKKLSKLGTLIISLAGGEPLMREDLCDIITELRRANHFPILITNGWFVDDAKARDLQRAGLQEISVSVDYASPEKHDQQRGKKGAWDRAIHALELLQKHRRDPRNRVHMISVLLDDNLEEIEEMIRLSKSLGVTYMVNLYSWNRGIKKPRLPENEVSAFLLSLKKKYPEFVTLTTYIERLDQAITEGGIGNCKTGKLLLNIDNQGNVARCTETVDEPVGNILHEDVWEIRKKLLKLQKEKECNQCWTSCRGFAESMFMPPRMRQFKEFFISVRSA